MATSPSNLPLLIQACRRQKVPRPPVWLMRQAGRYLPEYRALRDRMDFFTLCKTPELASQISILPVDILGVDAAIIFSDILLLLEGVGMTVQFGKDHGPRIPKPVRAAADVKKLRSTDATGDFEYLGEAIRLTARALAPRNIPVIGFAGAPFTLACYAIEGESSREFSRVMRFLDENPKIFTTLLEKLADAAVAHLRQQIAAGAAVIQIFDTWAGLLNRKNFRAFVLPALQRVIGPLKPLGAPIILYVNGGSPHLEAMAESGADVLSVDWRLPLSEVRRRVEDRVALQGNLDPAKLLESPEEIRRAAAAMLADHPGPGFIANLGHGILPETTVEHARAFVDAVKGD